VLEVEAACHKDTAVNIFTRFPYNFSEGIIHAGKVLVEKAKKDAKPN
jgi:hypothetical protein